jgi:hypothetical protein
MYDYIYNCSYIDIIKIDRGRASSSLVKRVLIDDIIKEKVTVFDLIGEECLNTYTLMFS